MPTWSGTRRVTYLQSALDVSGFCEGGTEFCLLNPQVVNDAGEWEAWFHAHWIPGFVRYPSFWGLVQDRCARFARVLSA